MRIKMLTAPRLDRVYEDPEHLKHPDLIGFMRLDERQGPRLDRVYEVPSLFGFPDLIGFMRIAAPMVTQT